MTSVVNFTPTTYTAGMVVTAPQLTQDVNQSWTNAQATWQSYTPTLTNITVGNGTLDCRYRRIGKNIDVLVTFVSGSTTSYGSGQLLFTPPVSPDAIYTGAMAGNIAVGSGFVNPASTRFGVTVAFNASSQFQLYASANVTNTSPATFGNPSLIGFTARYIAL